AKDEDTELVPDGKGHKPKDYKEPNGQGKTNGARPLSNGMVYHGGPVITSQANIHYIWYGNWGSNSAIGILESLARNIAPSSWFNINTTYPNGSSQRPVNSAFFAGSVMNPDTSKYGVNLSDGNIRSIVADQQPNDPNGVYFVLTSADVNATSGFCTQYCGWHTHGSMAGPDNVSRDI